MTPHRLKVLLVVPDREALRHLSRLLTVFGYEVRQADSFAAAERAAIAERPDIVMLDPTDAFDECLKFCQRFEQPVDGDYVVKLLLMSDSDAASVTAATEAGVDDILTWPLEHGELLTRMRVAARVLEYERRVRTLRNRDRATGLFTRRAFLARLEHDGKSHGKRQTVACVVFDIDFYRALCNRPGETCAQQAIDRVAATALEMCGGSEICARLSSDRFAVLRGSDGDTAPAWAEELRERIGRIELGTKEHRHTIAASVGVATAEGTYGGELLDRAEQALLLAKRSGRNCVALYNDVEQEDDRWSELGAAGKMFERTVARDVMTPSPVVVPIGTSVLAGRQLFQRTGLHAAPVVDGEGRLVGLLTANSLGREENADVASLDIQGFMTGEAASFDEQASLSELIECFTQDAPPLAVIVNKGRPTGVVTPSSLAALGEQITADSFAPTTDARDPSFLIVPNLCGADAD